MSYAVKELYLTLQGEGANTGRPAVFCRFSGCNLWSGREEDRAGAICSFCDTDFIGTNGPGGGRYEDAGALARAAAGMWPGVVDVAPKPLLVCTGGEPLLQLDAELIAAFHGHGFAVAIETNGTVAAPPGIDWICLSPKAGADPVIRSGNELKLVFPQHGAEPERYVDYDFGEFFLQPMDGPRRDDNTRAAVAYCLAHPKWRLSLQTHKYLGLP